jgi:hypothetical protein
MMTFSVANGALDADRESEMILEHLERKAGTGHPPDCSRD